MLPSRSLLFLWGVLGVSAFQDTSPFFYSTTDLTHPASQNIQQISKADDLHESLQERLSRCSSDVYILAVQPSVNAADFRLPDAAPRLRERMVDDEARASFSVSDVLGELDVNIIESFLHKTCKAEIMNVDASTGSFEAVEDMKPRVVRVEFPALPLVRSQRARKLRENDSFLSSLIDLLPTSRYTLIYATTPMSATEMNMLLDSETYAADQPKPSHKTHHYAATELKRAIHLRDDDDKDDNNDQPDVTLVDGPLFQRYQFLTPGLFMGLLVAFLLLGLLGVGFSALSSLQVSYGAFDKEMGPAAAAAQRKQG